MQNKQYNEEKRKYIRLKSVFPVEFLVLPTSVNKLGTSYWRQGYTCNVSGGGICLETTDLDKKTLEALINKSPLDIRLRLHLMRPMIQAKTEVAWIKKEEEGGRFRFYIGLRFFKIAPQDLNRLLRQARWHKFSLTGALFLVFIFFSAFIGSTFYNYQLRLANERLVTQMVALGQQASQENKVLEKVVEEKRIVREKIAQTSIDHGQDLPGLEKQYASLLAQEKQIADRVDLLNRQKEGLKTKVLKRMYQWLKNHQSLSTGLIQSFEGDVKIVKDWAFTYDQALAVNVFLLFNRYASSMRRTK